MACRTNKIICICNLSSLNAYLFRIRAFIICYGPKSTGKGWIELDSSATALDALKKLKDFAIRGQVLTLSMPDKNKQEKAIKKSNKPKKKVLLPYDTELKQVQAKFKDSFQYLWFVFAITHSLI